MKHNRRSEKRKRNVMVALRMLPDEFQAINAAARGCKVPLSRFIRDAALHLAREYAVEDAALIVGIEERMARDTGERIPLDEAMRELGVEDQ